MAYTLKSTGIATNLIMLLSIDDDGTTVKEFVSSAVNSAMTVHANVTTGTSTWKSTSRGYFQTYENSTYNFYGITFGTTKPTVGHNDADGMSYFAAAAGASAGTGRPGLVAYTGTSSYWGRHSSTRDKQSIYLGSDRVSSTTTIPSDGTTKFSMGPAFKNNDSSTTFYYGLESGSMASDGSGTPGDYGFTSESIIDIGGWAGEGSQPGKWHCIAVFNKQLSQAEMQSLHGDGSNDWFSTLFDAPTTYTPPVLRGQRTMALSGRR